MHLFKALVCTLLMATAAPAWALHCEHQFYNIRYDLGGKMEVDVIRAWDMPPTQPTILITVTENYSWGSDPFNAPTYSQSREVRYDGYPPVGAMNLRFEVEAPQASSIIRGLGLPLGRRLILDTAEAGNGVLTDLDRYEPCIAHSRDVTQMRQCELRYRWPVACRP